VIIAGSLSVFSSVAGSQVNPGIPPFSSVGGGQYDSINLSNLFITINLPVRKKPGAIPFNYLYSQYTYLIPGCIGGCGYHWTVGSTHAFSEEHGVGAKYLTAQQSGCPLGGSKTEYTNWVVIDASGTQHPVPGVLYLYSTKVGCAGGGNSGLTADGSGYTLSFANNVGTNPPSPIVYDRSGGLSSIGYSDPNGNQLSYASGSITDTLGQTAITETFSSGTGSYTDTATYTHSNGQNLFNESFIVTLPTTVTAQTAFGCSSTNDLSPTTVTLPSSVALPDLSVLGFTYEPTSTGSSNVTGRLQSITLPTGGTITYTYSGGTNGINCYDGSTSILQRATSDGIWTYAHTPPASGSTISVTTVTDPAGNRTDYTFSGNYETQRLVHQLLNGTQTLQETLLNCYNNNFTNCATAAVTAPITRIDAYRTPVGGQAALSETFYNTYGLVTQDNEFNYGINTGTAPSGTPLKATLITYAPPPASSTIYDRPSCVQVTVGNSPTSCGTITSNTVSITNYLNYDSHGNVGTVQRWVSGNNYLSRAFTYNANGTVATDTEVSGAVLTYGYNGTGGCNGVLPTSVTATGSGLPTGGLATPTQWDCDGGVVTQVTDANGQSTKYGFVDQSDTPDPFWRANSTTDPLLNITWNVYTPTTLETELSFPTSNPTSTVDVLKTLDPYGRLVETQRRTAPGSASFDQTVYYTYGWNSTGSVIGPFSTQTTPGGSALTTSQLDALGRIAGVTDGGGGLSSMTYAQNDVLRTTGPPPAGEHAKSRQVEYDALGRVTSVCEVLSSGGSSCGQHTTASGYKTSYTYSVPAGGGSQVSVTQGSQTRAYVYDGLDRMISETNPETGTTQYFWDAAPPACLSPNGWSTPGSLGAKKDNAGVYTCYGYDSLGRLLGWGNTLDNNCGALIYDAPQGSLPTGVTIANRAGRLIEAYTNSACNGKTSLVTDEYFSYSVRGELTDVYESTPHSSSYYHTTASYWANGALQSLSGIPGYTTTTYGVDGEGRLTSAQQGATRLVCDSSCSSSSTTYTSAGQVHAINIGGTGNNGLGDNDAYTYDPATGRMTNFTFTIGSPAKSFAGALAWNANGTLSNLAITDAFHSGGTQTCNYLYDDLGRIGTPPGSSSYSVDCGSALWRQTFTYDQYGNVTKTANPGISWLPGYNQTTNQFLTPANCVTAGGSPCYDADGNLLRDGSNAYTWNAYGKMASMNSGNSSAVCGTSGVCLTYDALGRVVEENFSGTYTEMLYSPLGKTANMSGNSTVNYSYLPLPGGATLYSFLAGGTGRFYQHKDWLGSARMESGIVNRVEEYDRAFAPFGEVYDRFDLSSQVNFTGDTQDISSILFDTANRELHPNEGRWLSPDPAGLGAVDFSNPQSWNRYAYVNNNPTGATDPSGLKCFPWFPGGCDSMNPPQFGWNWNEFDIIDRALSGSYEAPDPSKPWIVIGDNNGTIVVGGCGGCVNTEIPQLMTVYPNIGLLSQLFDHPAKNPMDWVIDDYSLLRLKQNWWKWALGYGAKVGAVKLLKPAASTVGYLGGLSTLMMLGSTMLDAVDPAKLPPPSQNYLCSGDGAFMGINWVPGPNGTMSGMVACQ
jgi:RHS repeat-associated protein